MADGYKVTMTGPGWDATFDALQGPVKYSLGRRMGVEGGVAYRDEAKRWAPVSEGQYNPNSRGSHAAGTLRDAIYLAFDEEGSTDTWIQYVISWNAKKAWWGKLAEFGHLMPYVTIFNIKLGAYQSLAKGRSAQSKAGNYNNGVLRPGGAKWIAPKSFMRPSFDITTPRVLDIMGGRAQRELPILLKEHIPNES